MLEFAEADTPVVGHGWRSLGGKERIAQVENQLSAFDDLQSVDVTRCLEEGAVYLNFQIPIAAHERGALLRRFERILKDQIDAGITVWCEPLGDKNSLRKLRGIEYVNLA